MIVKWQRNYRGLAPSRDRRDHIRWLRSQRRGTRSFLATFRGSHLKSRYVLLHLSDIHFGQERGGNIVFHDDVRQELCNDATNVRREVGDADYVLVTGDIAFSGLSEQFVRAGVWLEELCGRVGCQVESVLVVPGNHDVDRRDAKGVVKQMHDSIRNAPIDNLDVYLSDYYGDKNAEDILLRKLKNYRQFAERYGCAFESCRRPYSLTVLDQLNRGKIRLFGLNSVLISDADDAREKLILGKNQFIISREVGTEDVVLLHHPLTWLKDEKPARAYFQSRVRILLTGHEHDLQVEKRTSMDGFERLEICAGATNPPDGEGYEFRYNWLTLSLTADAEPQLVVGIYPRVWDRRRTVFIADQNLLGGALSKEFTLKGSVAQEAEGVRSMPAEPRPAPRQEAIEPVKEDPRVRRLRFLYWKELSRSQRLQVMVNLGILPDVGDQLTMTLEREALNLAGRQRKLGRLWAAIMAFLPPARQEANPFREGE